MIIFAIDPGTTQSAYCMVGNTEGVPLQIISFAKLPNAELIPLIRNYKVPVVIERLQSFGMPVGQEVLRTSEWVGRYTQVAEDLFLPVSYVVRQEEKLTVCHSSRANDATIRHALIDRFASHDFKTGKGTKAHPDFFYGFKADCWSAFAVAVTWFAEVKTFRQ